MYEQRGDKLITKKEFVHRLLKTATHAAIIIVVSLFIGVAGYHFFENLSWLDSLLNASMILGGMGPVDQVKTTGGKLFASFYAIYSGLVLIGLIGFFLAPVFHRVMHSFHDKCDTGK